MHVALRIRELPTSTIRGIAIEDGPTACIGRDADERAVGQLVNASGIFEHTLVGTRPHRARVPLSVLGAVRVS